MGAPSWQLFLRPGDAETESSCGTSVAEAREALAFWRRRLQRLPWYRAAARAEAREMAARWQRRLVHAELERWRLGGLTTLVLALIDVWRPLRTSRTRRVATWVLLMARASTVGRLVVAVAVFAAITWLAVLALIAVAIAQLL